ncbi:hypothetical protein DPX16_0087 [Anabarilius grahami]|uniref:SecA DEAD-like N-terminal domain-containing protein n=1 Tax=Anabarilius grahami TaxID=495550 RepID=A0A3N0Z9V2_ANAGA|nr:hypothetical protein DPX16_0087 [Anabarilius grahami]
MAGRRLPFNSPSTPLHGRDQPLSASPQTGEKKLLNAISGLSRQPSEQGLAALESKNCVEDTNSRMRRRVHNPKIALLQARQSVLAEDEVGLWKCATIDLMSDEEDGIVDGVSGWIVRPPSFRSQELTERHAAVEMRGDSKVQGNAPQTSAKWTEFRQNAASYLRLRSGKQTFHGAVGLWASLMCYECQVLYGTTQDFAGDFLRQRFHRRDLRPKRKFQCVIVDEVDSLMLDKDQGIGEGSPPRLRESILNRASRVLNNALGCMSAGSSTTHSALSAQALTRKAR